jgi:hypothetical protein
MFAILGLIFPFVGRLLGDGLVEKILADKRARLASANEQEKVRLEADIKYGEQLLEEKRIKRDLQLKEYEYAIFRYPKAILMLSVAAYWASRFFARTLGLDDFSIEIKDLSEPEAAVSMMVLTYWFLDGVVKRVVRK